MSWLDRVSGDPIKWLCENDPVNPAIRYFVLRDLFDLPAGDPEVVAAQAQIMSSGPVPVILEAQHPDGYWLRPGTGYAKYQGTEWQIILLGELGADPNDARVRRGCDYLFDHSIAANGAFACTARPTPSGVVHCLNGNLLYALICLGYLDDPRVQAALDWQARVTIGDLAHGSRLPTTSDADFACAANGHRPCAWGATKAMKALAAVPAEQRTPAVQAALTRGAALLLQYDLAKADYPYTGKVSSAWFKLGFPLSYWSDLLETLTVLVTLGHGDDRRLAPVFAWILGKQDAQGRWKLENSLNGKMWVDIEQKGKPSKWVTLRVLRVLKAADLYQVPTTPSLAATVWPYTLSGMAL